MACVMVYTHHMATTQTPKPVSTTTSWTAINRVTFRARAAVTALEDTLSFTTCERLLDLIDRRFQREVVADPRVAAVVAALTDCGLEVELFEGYNELSVCGKRGNLEFEGFIDERGDGATVTFPVHMNGSFVYGTCKSYPSIAEAIAAIDANEPLTV